MARAVVDSSTPIHLARIDSVPLLADLFDEVLIPPAVWDEVVVQGEGLPGATEVRSACEAGWMTVVDLDEPKGVDRAGGSLDQGEAQAIALALEEDVDVLVLDETVARDEAREQGLSTTGLVGLVLVGYRRGYVDDLEEVLEHLRATGFWLGDAMVREILRRA